MPEQSPRRIAGPMNSESSDRRLRGNDGVKPKFCVGFVRKRVSSNRYADIRPNTVIPAQAGIQNCAGERRCLNNHRPGFPPPRE